MLKGPPDGCVGWLKAPGGAKGARHDPDCGRVMISDPGGERCFGAGHSWVAASLAVQGSVPKYPLPRVQQGWRVEGQLTEPETFPTCEAQTKVLYANVTFTPVTTECVPESKVKEHGC